MHDARFSLKPLLLVHQEAVEIFGQEMHARTGSRSGMAARKREERYMGRWDRDRSHPSICFLEAFLREPKLSSQSTEALREMAEAAQGKRMLAERMCDSQWASLPADSAPTVLRGSRVAHRSCGC